jgi:hypothetical protein
MRCLRITNKYHVDKLDYVNYKEILLLVSPKCGTLVKLISLLLDSGPRLFNCVAKIHGYSFSCSYILPYVINRWLHSSYAIKKLISFFL